MKDQAEKLRSQLKKIEQEDKSRTIAIVSGKGGVGKSNFTLNFAIALSKNGHKVLLFDMDLGMGNIDILVGRSSKYSIVHYINSNIPLEDIIMEGPGGISYIAGGTGLTHLVKLEDDKLNMFMSDLQKIMEKFDYILFDMGAGVSKESLQLIVSVHDVFVITTPEPTSITDAYATMKHLHLLDSNLPFYLICNRAQNEKEGKETLQRLESVLLKFLNKKSNLLGVLPDDRTVQRAVSRQTPFLQLNPHSEVSKALFKIVESYQNGNFDDLIFIKRNGFFKRFKQIFGER